MPRGEWVAIPVSLEGSGLERAKVEAARASVADNRVSAQVGDRDCWELSRCFLRCGACGRSMSAYRRRKASGGALYYYRCQPPSAAHACTNRKSHPAEQLEYEATRLFERYADRGMLLELDPFIAKDRAFAAPDFYPGQLEYTQFERKQYGVPSIALSQFEIDIAIIKLVPAETARKYQIVPPSAPSTTCR